MPSAPGARASLALLLLINLFNYIDRYILAAVEPRIRAEFFAPDDPSAKTWMGALPFVFLICYMLTAPIFGWLGDRMKRWMIVAVGVALWSFASGASGLAQTFTLLVLTRIFVGIGEAAYGPVAPTLIADYYPIARRGAVLAWFYAAIPVGSALGYVLGGNIAKFADSWRAPFFAVVAPGLLLALLCLFFREPPRGQTDTPAATRRAGPRDYAVLLKTPSYLFNLLGMTAMTFAIGGISFWTPTYIMEFRRAGDESHVNTLFGAVTVVTGLAATLSGGLLADRLRPRIPGSYFLVAGLSMILAFPLFLLVLITPFPAAWFLMAAAIFCIFFGTGPTNTILANVAHPSIRASAFAISILVIHLFGDAISPWIIGLITDRTRGPAHPDGNMNAGFLVVGFAILLAGIFWLLGTRHLARDTALAPTRLG